MRTTKRRLSIIIMLLTIAILACTLGPTPIITPQPTMQATPSDTASNTLHPDPPTATTPPNPCPVQQTLPPPEKQGLALYPEDVRDYLTQGGSPGDIPLAEWERYLTVDLTGYQVSEDNFVFIDPASEFFPPESALVIYQCNSGTVNILQSFEPEEWWGLEIVGADDLTEDNSIDFIFSEVSCGAHTCWHTLHVWSWTGTGFTDSVGGELSFPYPDYLLESGQLLVTSAGIGSVGAGPQRPTFTTVAWNGTVVTATNTTVGPAEYRYHAFVDGDTALYAGQYDSAFSSYMRVIQATDLNSWGAFYATDEEHRWLIALAHWRMMNLSVLKNELDASVQHYADLRNNFPPDSAGYPVVQISERFWLIIESGESILQACSVVRSLPEMLPIIDFLNSFGYANPFYDVDELCFSPPN